MSQDSGLAAAVGRSGSHDLGARRARSTDGGLKSNLTTALSLNLMLLAFFVVLASSATFDAERVDTAIESLQRKFGTTALDRRSVPGASAETEAQATLREAVASAFAAVLPGYEIVVPSATDRIDVRVPVAALFDDGSFELRGTLPVLDRLVGLLSAPPAGFRFEVILSATAGGDDPAVAVVRADAVATGLTQRGLDAELISAGSAPTGIDAPQAIIFSFLVVDAEDDMPLRRYLAGGAA